MSTRLDGLFKNEQEYVENLAFSNYYHSDPGNRLCHFVANVIQIFVASYVLSSYNIVLWLAFFGLYDYYFARVHLHSTYFFVLIQLAGLFSPRAFSNGLLGTLFVFSLLLLLVGHFVVQKKSPYFSLFEALFITPSLVTLYFQQDWLGLHSELLNQVEEKTPMWKGSERFKSSAKK